MYGRPAIINCFAENDYTNRIYNDGSIIVVDGIYDGRQYIIGIINHLIKWIKSKQKVQDKC